ncbi:MAG: hypothetical protein KF858_00400 [Candidatus Sumerlaeia bacterium]|nr:hypothetical protein [Candidatus Sumerlaeia bacterium]
MSNEPGFKSDQSASLGSEAQQELRPDLAASEESDSSGADVALPSSLVENAPRFIREFMAIASHSSGPLPNPIAKKFTAEHIDKLLANSSKEEEHRHSQYLHRNYTWLIVLALLLAFLVFCILKIEDADLVKMIVATVFGFLAGGLGGFGLGRATR